MSQVGKSMSHTLYATSPDQYAHEAIDDMYKNNISALLVQGERDYEWIITKTDWMLLVLKGECDPKALKVSDLMTRIVHTIDTGRSIAEACALIQENKVRHLPVTDNGKIVGMLSVKDIESYFLKLHKQTDY